MERQITVKVKVSSKKHAELIRKEIKEVVELRTTIFHVSDVMEPDMSIEDTYREEEES